MQIRNLISALVFLASVSTSAATSSPTKGAITVDVTPLDQMGIDDKTMLRLLKLGVMDFAGMDISKMAGDDPRFEGCDLAGLTLDPDKARAA